MKIDKKITKKFCKTARGKMLYKGNILAFILYVLSLSSLFYIIINEGKIITGLISGLALFATAFAMFASFLISTYYFALQEFAKREKK